MEVITFLVMLLILILDIITKIVASSYLTIGNPVTIINNFLYLNLAHNKGAAFSIMNNHTEILIILSIVILFFLYKYQKELKKTKLNSITFGLIYGGLIGNLIDRIFRGYVVDFIDIYIFKYDYPIFNVADIAIVIGIMILLIDSFRKESQNGNNSSRRKYKN